MRQTSKTRRTIGIRGQLMGFLCFICLLLVGLFWFLSTQLLEPLYTTHIQKQLTEQAEAIVARMDEAIGKGETLSYWPSAAGCTSITPSSTRCRTTSSSWAG